MQSRHRMLKHLARGTAALALLVIPAAALAPGDSEESYLRAYYLENERGETEAALALYEHVAADGTAPGELREAAESKAEGLREDLAARDFARLVPSDTIMYAQLSEPGRDLERLLDQLGLLGSEGQGAHGGVGVSPALVSGLLGLRGAALAITEIDMRGGPPSGVLLLHPGNLDLVRGLVETMVPVAGLPTEPIHGHATYEVQGQALVTFTSRLIIAGSDRALIQGVIERLNGGGSPSLAENPQLASMVAAEREGMLFFCINAEPVKPLLNGLLAQAVQQDQEAAMVASLVDVDSLVGLSGSFGVQEDGIAMNVALHLEEGHQNLIFNLLRMPNVDRRTVELVPAGVAFMHVSTLNPRSEVAQGTRDSKGQPVVTLMDFGREIFGNLTDLAIFALPPEGRAKSGLPIPDIAAVLRVNDIERSKALWNLVLGLASQAATGGEFAPEEVRVSGVQAEVFAMGPVSIFLATQGNDLILTPTRSALTRTLSERASGRTIYDDPLFATHLGFVNEACTSASLASAGRCAQLAEPFLSQGELQRLRSIAPLFEETILSYTTDQSETRLALNASVRNLPNVQPLVTMALEQRKGQTHRAHSAEVAALRPVELLSAPVPAQAEHARPVATASLSDQFETLAIQGKNPAAANQLAKQLVDSMGEDSRALNNFAWGLLTEERYGEQFDEVAKKASLRSNELSGFSSWFYLDTLGLACFRTGELKRAVEFQQKAVEIAGSDEGAAAARASLKRYRKSLAASSGR